MLEKKLEQRIGKEVQRLGGLFLKWVSPGCVGVPDRIIVMPGGQIWFVEFKQDTGAVSPRQKYVHRQLRDRGAAVRTVYGQQEALWLLEELRRGTPRQEDTP